MTPPTQDDVLLALELLAARVPDRHVSPDQAMAIIWRDDLFRFPREVVFAAARNWNKLSFPSTVEFIEACQVEARAQMANPPAKTLPAPEHGCDDGWIETDCTGHGTYYPCPSCRPVQYAMWAHRTDPNHPERCGECGVIRRNPKKDWPQWLQEAYDQEARNGTSAEPTF